MNKILAAILNAPPHQQTRWLVGLNLLAAAGALSFAYTAEYGFGLRPCILCLYQRVPYWSIVVIAGLSVLLRHQSTLKHDFRQLWFFVLLYVVEAGIAFYQVGVERDWWRGTEGCTGPVLQGLSVEEMMAKIDTAPIVSCRDVQFEVFGISMAGYNGLLAIGLALALMIALLKIRSAARRP